MAKYRDSGGWAYAQSLLLIAAVTAAASLMPLAIGAAAVDLLYLIPVMAAAGRFGLRHGLLAGAASALAYNFFFTEPLHSFHIDDPRNIVTVLMLFGVALVTSRLASQMREQAELAVGRARLNEDLAGFARQLISCTDEVEVGTILCAGVTRLFGVNAILLMNRQGVPELLEEVSAANHLTGIDLAAAVSALEGSRIAGRGSSTLSGADWLFYPIGTEEATLALLGLARDDGLQPVSSDQAGLLNGLLDQAALGFERAALEAGMTGVAQLRERDRLQGALLSSVGHDLRTPLTAILASAAELRRKGRAADRDLLDTLEGEARRLDRLIANLLDMARVEAGAIKLNLEAVDLTDAVASAAHDVRRSLEGHRLIIDIPPDLPLIRTDPQLLHHCLINLLDNAGRYADASAPVTVSVIRFDSGMRLTVGDEGPGIAEGTEIFEPFSGITDSSVPHGNGLGLAIVKGFAEAMEIGFSAANRGTPRGAEFQLDFPERSILHDVAEANA